MVDALTQTLDTLWLIFIYGWPFLILIWLFILKLLYKKWPVEAIIIEKRNNQLIKTNDRAGRYQDTFTGIIGYKLKKSKDTIPVLNYDWIMYNMYKPTTISERIVHLLRGNIGTIFLFRYGSKQYKPVKIVENGKTKIVYQEIKDSKGNPVIINIYEPTDPRSKMGALDFEVVDWDNMNFMVQEQRASIERRKKKSDWLKQILIPIAMLAITAVICIIMIKFSYDYSISLKSATPSVEQTAKPAEAPKIPVISNFVPGS